MRQTTNSSWLLGSIVPVLAAFGMCGCASPDPRYFTLAQSDGPRVASQCGFDGDAQQPSIEVLPVRVPERLNRTGILIRTGDTVKILEYDRWVAPFPDELRDALVQKLQRGRGPVDRSSRRNAILEEFYRVSVDVIQMDAELDAQLRMLVNWRIRKATDGTTWEGQSHTTFPAPGGILGTVGAYRHGVESIADDLCQALSRVKGR